MILYNVNKFTMLKKNCLHTTYNYIYNYFNQEHCSLVLTSKLL